MQKEKEQQPEIITVNIFKSSEEKRKKIFVDTMAKTIARNEVNLKIIRSEDLTHNH